MGTPAESSTVRIWRGLMATVRRDKTNPMGDPAPQDTGSIHPSAVIDRRACIGRGVTVGPFSVIGPDVEVGDHCVIHNHVTLTGHTKLGPHCQVYPGAILGSVPQDLKYRGEASELIIGEGNIIREQCTAHIGTHSGGGVTRIGDNNLIMAGVHIGHDAQIGNRCVMANLTLLAGHVLIEDYVTLGGACAIHHFTTVGRHAMVGGVTKVTTDVPPFLTVAGTRSTRQEVRMVNGVGLKRRGFTEEQIRNIKTVFMRLYSRRARATGVPIMQTAAAIRAENIDENVNYLCDFLLRSFECGRNGRYLESLRTDDKNLRAAYVNNTLRVAFGGRAEEQQP